MFDCHVQGELMEGENAYLCEELGKRVPAVKRACIRQLPHTLVIHLKRFEFDYHTQTRYKVRDRFEFPQELDMFRYTADGLAAMEQQQQQAAGSSTGGTSPDTDSAGSSGLQHAASDASQQLEVQHAAYMYDLKGMVVHSGSAFTGHYYSYIKERAHYAVDGSTDSGEWYCFDDKSVRGWDIDNLEPDCYGGRASQDWDSRIRPTKQECDRPHSAYMLFYERRCEWESDAQALTLAAPSAVAAHSASSNTSTGGGSMAGDVVMTGQQQTGAVFRTPYDMPLSLYKEVQTSNIIIMHRLHVFDKDYFKFVRQLVDSKCDGQQLSSRKARRREPASGGSGSSGRMHSASCDVAASAVAANGTAVPPVAASGTAADGPGGLTAMDLPSPGPSGRRVEDQEAVALSLTRVATLFQMQVYLQAHNTLRADHSMWVEAMKSLMGCGPSSMSCLALFMTLVEQHPEWLSMYLVHCPIRDVQVQAAELFTWVLNRAVNRSNLTQHMAQQQEPTKLTTALLNVVEQLVQLLKLCTFGNTQLSALEAARVLLEYARSSPVHCVYLAQATMCLPFVVQASCQLALPAKDGDEDSIEELIMLYKLAYQMLKYADNIDALTAEYNAVSAVLPSPISRAADASYSLPSHTYKILMENPFLMGLALPPSLKEADCVALVGLLICNNELATHVFWIGVVETLMHIHTKDLMELHSQHLANILVLPDAIFDTRITLALIGAPTHPSMRSVGLLQTLVDQGYPLVKRAWACRFIVELSNTNDQASQAVEAVVLQYKQPVSEALCQLATLMQQTNQQLFHLFSHSAGALYSLCHKPSASAE